jgi:hypothetical protein
MIDNNHLDLNPPTPYNLPAIKRVLITIIRDEKMQELKI